MAFAQTAYTKPNSTSPVTNDEPSGFENDTRQWSASLMVNGSDPAMCAGVWLAVTGVDRSKAMLWTVGFSIAAAFAIDVVHVYYPKPGHVAGVVLGVLMTALHRDSASRRAGAEPT